MIPDYYSGEEIRAKIDPRLTLDNHELREFLIQALTRLPAFVVDAVLKNCLFALPAPEDYFCFVPNRVIGGRHLMVFPPRLTTYPEEERVNFILHVVAHYILHHWSPVERRDIDYRQQELEADGLVDLWLRQWRRHRNDVKGVAGNGPQ